MSDHYSETQPTSLHEVIRGLGGDLAEGEAVWRFEQLARLVREGADPNEEDAHDMTPLAILMDEHVIINSQVGVIAQDMVATLIQAGANPLIKDRAIGKSDRSQLGMVMVEEIIFAAEKGRLVQAEDGGNLLHVLAEDDLNLLGWVLNRKESARAADSFNLPAVWLSECRQSDGATPAHALLSEDSIIVSYVENDMDADEYFDPAWNCLRLFIALGVDLKTKNADGMTIANFIADKVGEGTLPVEDEETWAVIESFSTHETLQKKTRKAPGKGRQSRF